MQQSRRRDDTPNASLVPVIRHSALVSASPQRFEVHAPPVLHCRCQAAPHVGRADSRYRPQSLLSRPPPPAFTNLVSRQSKDTLTSFLVGQTARTAGMRSISAFRIILFSLSPPVKTSARSPDAVASANTDSQNSIEAVSPDNAKTLKSKQDY